jgi:hypothetical protein
MKDLIRLAAPQNTFTDWEDFVLTFSLAVLKRFSPPLGLIPVYLYLSCPAVAQIAFDPPLNYSVEAIANGAFATADLNGDGHPDVLVGNGSIPGIAVLLNKGDGSLTQPPTMYGTGGNPAGGIVASDLNGDGRPDLAFPAHSGIGIMLNKGDGTFGSPAFYGTPDSIFPVSIASGDFYHDGRTHVATLRVGFFGCCATLKVFRNQGDGTFLQDLVVGLPEGAVGIASGDVNNDGYPDIATANGNTNGTPTVSVLTNLRNGTFSPAAIYPSFGGRRLAVADLNQDGFLDLIVQGPGSVLAMLNKRDGTYGPAAAYRTGDLFPLSIDAADLDGDGYPELMANNYGTLVVLQNNKDGTFGAPLTFPVAQNQSGSAADLLHVDLDSDGDLDLILGDSAQNPDSTSIHVLKNKRFQPVPIEFFPDHGGNAGSVTLRISSPLLQEGVTVKLIAPGQPDAISQTAVFSTDSAGKKVLEATFDLSGATPGVRQVVLIFPDGNTVALSRTFTIREGGAAEFWVDLLGWNVIRAGRDQVYYIQIGNRGSVDGDFGSVWLVFPDFVAWKIENISLPYVSVAVGEEILLSFEGFSIPAGTIVTIPIKFAVPDDAPFAHRFFDIRTWISQR